MFNQILNSKFLKNAVKQIINPQVIGNSTVAKLARNILQPFAGRQQIGNIQTIGSHSIGSDFITQYQKMNAPIIGLQKQSYLKPILRINQKQVTAPSVLKQTKKVRFSQQQPQKLIQFSQQRQQFQPPLRKRLFKQRPFLKKY